MTTLPMSETGTPEEQLVRALLAARGFQRGEYAFFFTTGEGRFLPLPDREIEEVSGNLVDREGRHFFFWLGWDEATRQPALIRWRAVQPDKRWLRSVEYREALKEVGLPVPA